MDKCEHGQRIDRFCASQCCVWRQGAGCSNICMKKYHNHMGPSIIVPQKQVQSLLKKYKVQNWVKPKVKTLQQTIHNYFNYLKIELNNYIDEVDKKLRTELCYPYLSKYGIVGVYKKLKKREYKKVQQREFRQFYEQTQNLKIEDFTKEEQVLYEKELGESKVILLDLFKSFNVLEDSLKGIGTGVNFQMDKNFEQKIRLIFDNVNFSKKDIVVEQEIKEKFEDVSVVQNKIIQKHMSKERLDKPLITKWSSTGNTGRKKSLDTINDSINLESSSLHKNLQKKNSRKSKEEIDKMKNEIVNLMSNSSTKKDESNFDLTVTGPQNAREPTVHSDASSRENITDSKPRTTENKNYLTVDVKPVVSSSIQSLALSEKFGGKNKEKTEHSDITEIRHDVLPSHTTNFPEDKERKKPNDLRLVVVPFKADKQIEPSELSPLIQKRKKFFDNEKLENEKQGGGLFNLVEVKEESPTKESPPRTPEKPMKPKRSPEEDRSIQLLTEAIQSKGDDAIPLLKQALKIAPNNLSAAEYLSFLLLQAGNAKQCLRVCNNIHEQLQDEMIYQSSLFHINNNRAVALLMLGRYSEAISGLQKALSIGQNPLTYKNLGDAYYSIGIYEKAVYNYEKSISLKPSGEAYFNLAVCLFVQQNFHNSLIMAELAVKASPEIPEYVTLVKEIKSNI